MPHILAARTFELPEWVVRAYGGPEAARANAVDRVARLKGRGIDFQEGHRLVLWLMAEEAAKRVAAL
jgi:hypothetical protein